MGNWNDRLFLLINASDHPAASLVSTANLVAADVVFLVVLLFGTLWVWGRSERRAALLASVCATALALAANQALGLLWYEPRPFMIGLGHTFSEHAVENSFPSDHATFMFTAGLSLISTGAARRWGIVVALAGIAVAWARIYLGLHFPVDMLSSAMIALVFSLIAVPLKLPIGRTVIPVGNRLYDAILDALRFPTTFFPRTPE
jgi:undecaprenyl-diphosphatase